MKGATDDTGPTLVPVTPRIDREKTMQQIAVPDALRSFSKWAASTDIYGRKRKVLRTKGGGIVVKSQEIEDNPIEHNPRAARRRAARALRKEARNADE